MQLVRNRRFGLLELAGSYPQSYAELSRWCNCAHYILEILAIALAS